MLVKSIGVRKNKFQIILICLLTVWFAFSFFRLIYNYTVFLRSDIYLLGKSDEEIRKETFGDFYIFLRFIKSRVKPGSSILFIGDQPREHFLSMYFLYPSMVRYSDAKHIGENFSYNDYII